MTAVCGIVMALAPHNDDTYLWGVMTYALITGFCYSAFTATVLETIGQGGKAASTQYALFVAAGNVAIAYVGFVDTRFGGKEPLPDGGTRPLVEHVIASDAALNLIGVAILGFVFWKLGSFGRARHRKRVDLPPAKVHWSVRRHLVILVVIVIAAALAYHFATPDQPPYVPMTRSAAPSVTTPPAGPHTIPAHVTKLGGAEQRRELADRIAASQAAHGAHSAAAAPGLPGSGSDDTHDLERLSTKALDALHEVLPFLADCYRAADRARDGGVGKTAAARITTARRTRRRHVDRRRSDVRCEPATARSRAPHLLEDHAGVARAAAARRG